MVACSKNILGFFSLLILLVSCGTQQEYGGKAYSHLLDDKFECADGTFAYAKKQDISIQILGDSTFKRGTGCGSIGDVLFKYTSLSQIYNNSISSGEILADGYKGILSRYDANITADYIIISGGGVDFWKCGSRVQCQKKTAMLIRDKISNFIIKNSIKPESVIFISHTGVANNAPMSLRSSIRSGGGREIRKMYRALNSRFEGSIFIDFTKLTGVTSSTMWEHDGYHPTTEAYKRLVVHLLRSGKFVNIQRQ